MHRLSGTGKLILGVLSLPFFLAAGTGLGIYIWIAKKRRSP